MSPVTQEEQDFHKLLTILATRCNTDLDRLEFGIYDTELAGYGYARVNAALRRLITDRGPNDRMPTVSQIRAIIDPDAEPEARAQLISDRIFGCISKKGHTWPQTCGKRDFRKVMDEYFGKAGAWAVCNMGGWQNLCEITTTDNATTIKAQLRRSVRAALQCEAQGFLPGVPFETKITFDPPLEIGGPPQERVSRAEGCGAIDAGSVLKDMPK